MTDTRTTRPPPSQALVSLRAPRRAAAGGALALLAIAALAVFASLGFNWIWLVAAGIGSLMLGFLPCAAMCALGLCAMRMGRKGAAWAPSGDSAQGMGRELLSSPDLRELSETAGSGGAS